MCDKYAQILLKIVGKIKSGVHNLFKIASFADC